LVLLRHPIASQEIHIFKAAATVSRWCRLAVGACAWRLAAFRVQCFRINSVIMATITPKIAAPIHIQTAIPRQNATRLWSGSCASSRSFRSGIGYKEGVRFRMLPEIVGVAGGLGRSWFGSPQHQHESM